MTDELVDGLAVSRADFLATLEGLAPARLAAPAIVNDWSARELVAHLGYWAGHVVEVINAVEDGRADELGVGEPSVDALNETIARVARQTDLATARKREAASAQALLDRLGVLDPMLLSERLPGGGTLRDGIREDGAEHYREHTAELRALP